MVIYGRVYIHEKKKTDSDKQCLEIKFDETGVFMIRKFTDETGVFMIREFTDEHQNVY